MCLGVYGGILPLYFCGKAELGFVLGGSVCIANLGLLLLGAALGLKWGSCCGTQD